MDSAFKIVPRGYTCFLTFRIENFQPVPVPQDQYGCFFDGDAYLVLAAFQPGEESGALTKVKESKGSLDIRIHIWLGENTTQVESSAAVAKAAELEDYVGITTQLYRDFQGHESVSFLNYFRRIGGIRYSLGSHTAGFSHIDHTVKPRLMHVKGKHYPRIQEVSIDWSSMCENSVYILDVGQVLFVWNGKYCSYTEKIKAMDYARKLRDGRGKGNVVIVDDGEESKDEIGEDVFEVFSEYLPLSQKSKLSKYLIQDGVNGTSNGHSRGSLQKLKLWQYSEEGSQLKMIEISQAPLVKGMLDSKDCFMIDNGEDGIWIWCGRDARNPEKQEAIANALAFAAQQKYHSYIPIGRIHEGCEPAEFRMLFRIWEKEKVSVPQKIINNRFAPTVQTKFDALTMAENPQIAVETGMVDDGSGSKTIWRVELQDDDYLLVELEKKYRGQLYGGDCYVILYSYQLNRVVHNRIYYWLGRKSTSNEVKAATSKAIQLDESLGDGTTLVRVVHGKEPNHFLAMFGGKLVIFSGGKTGWNNQQQQQDDGPGDSYLLQVSGSAAYATKAEQVPCTASSLNSNDVFVLFSKSGIFVWAGKGCTGDEREMGKQIASVSPKGYHILTEGQEREEFWNGLGGKGDYANLLLSPVELEEKRTCLFQCCSIKGVLSTNRIINFSQQDLLAEDVFILDAHDRIYVWLGQEARPGEKDLATEAALDYVASDPSGRDTGCPVFIIRQRYEPPDFIGYFSVWNKDMWDTLKTYEQLKSELSEKNVAFDEIKHRNSTNGEFCELAKVPYEVLRRKEDLPDGLDLQHKEKHLTSEEFQEIFLMTHAEFVMLPLWKQQQLKKQTSLW